MCVAPLILIKLFAEKLISVKKIRKKIHDIIWKLTEIVSRPINFLKIIRDKNKEKKSCLLWQKNSHEYFLKIN